jgi:hypothetical protein
MSQPLDRVERRQYARAMGNLEQSQLGIDMEYVKGYMLDSNAFDKVVDHKIYSDLFSTHPIFVTHIQKGELENTPDAEKRAALLNILHQVGVIPTESFIWGVSRWGECTWHDGDDGVLQTLRGLKPTTDIKIGNHDRDALIAYSAFKNDLTLVTEDKDLLKKMKSVGGKAIDVKSFLNGSGHPLDDPAS